MKIFDKRPLSLILCMLLGGFVFFSIFDDAWRVSVSCIGALLLLFAIFVPLKEFKGRILTIISSVAILLGCLLSFLYFDLYFFIDEDFDGETEIYGVITEAESFSYGKNLTIRMESINGENDNGHKILAFVSLDECEGISEGSRVRLVAELASFDDVGDYDIAAYYHASGYSATVVDVKEIEYVEYVGEPLQNKIEDYREALCRRIIMYSDEESGGLLCALLLGERDYLSAECRHDFARLGLSHMLALSGLHLAILSFAIEMVLSRLGVMKKPRKIVQVIFVLLYMALTGFPTSVMRAGIMLIITSVLFLLSHRADSITTLFISVALILIIEPYSAFDISLWLSSFATLGILLFTEFNQSIKDDVKTVKSRLWQKLAMPVLISLFALGATLLISASSFKKLSLLSPITTPLYSAVIEIYMYLGMLLLICGPFLSLGTVAKPFGSLIISSIRWISSINGIYISAEYAIVTILLIIFTVSLCAFAILNVSRKKSAVALLVCMLAIVFISSLSCSVYSRNADHFDYVSEDSREWIVMQDNGSFALLDIGTPTTKAAALEVQYLNNIGLLELDSYIFTSYSSYTLNTVGTLLGSIFIKNLYFPAPQNDDELSIAEKLISESSGSKSDINFYNTGEFIECGEFNLFPAYRSANKNKLALTIYYRDEFYTYLSSGMLENDTKNVALPLIDGCNTLILGRHGNSYSNYKFTYQITDLDKLVVSINDLTLPSETKRYYGEQGTNLYYSPEKVELYVE